jgi:hypothetical protein
VVEGVVGALVLFLEQRRQVAGRLWSTVSFGKALIRRFAVK